MAIRPPVTSLAFLGEMSDGWFEMPSASAQGSLPKYVTEVTMSAKSAPAPVPASLKDMLQTACATGVEREFAPTRDRFKVLRSALDSYEKLLREDVERRVLGSMLAAVGQAIPEESPELAKSRGILVEALSVVREDVAPPASVTEPEPELAPPSKPVETPVAQQESRPLARHSPARPPRPADPQDEAAARIILDEIKSLRESDPTQMHHSRLAPLMQAIVAEIRWVVERLPSDHALSWQLTQGLRYMASIRYDTNLNEFIRGLARDHQDDWQRVSHDARKRLAQFDVDSEASPSSKSEPKSKECPASNGNGKSYTWPELPALRRHVKGKVFLIAGGICKDEKLKGIQARFGFDLEWVEIEVGKRGIVTSLNNRIRNGKIGAVILLEGLVAHDVYREVFDACAASDVPFAMADKGGTASVSAALEMLERRLQGAPALETASP